MNGPAYALMGVVFLVGVVMVVSAALRRRRQAGRWSRRERWAHLGLVMLWLGTLVFIPVVAEPGSQPKLSAFAQAVILILLGSAGWDLRHGRRQEAR